MPQLIEGTFDGAGRRFAVVVSRFNEFITGKLLGGAMDGLRRHGVHEDAITVVWVPGSWETPLVAKKLAESGKFDAVIALGCVIRGATAHFDYVSGAVARGVAEAMLVSGVPVIFGVLTTDTIEQAVERAGTKAGNKGFDAAMAALEMASLNAQLETLAGS